MDYSKPDQNLADILYANWLKNEDVVPIYRALRDKKISLNTFYDTFCTPRCDVLFDIYTSMVDIEGIDEDFEKIMRVEIEKLEEGEHAYADEASAKNYRRAQEEEKFGMLSYCDQQILHCEDGNKNIDEIPNHIKFKTKEYDKESGIWKEHCVEKDNIKWKEDYFKGNKIKAEAYKKFRDIVLNRDPEEFSIDRQKNCDWMYSTIEKYEKDLKDSELGIADNKLEDNKPDLIMSSEPLPIAPKAKVEDIPQEKHLEGSEINALQDELNAPGQEILPQEEVERGGNGHLRISHRKLFQVLQADLSKEAIKILLAILDRLLGHGKSSGWIALGVLSQDTKIKRSHVCRGLTELKNKNWILKKGKNIEIIDYKKYK